LNQPSPNKRRTLLVWCLRSSLNNSLVIPDKLAAASAIRNPGITKTFWMPAFAGMTVGEPQTCYVTFSDGRLASRPYRTEFSDHET